MSAATTWLRPAFFAAYIAASARRTSAEVLMAAADAALYDAKKAGRNTCRLVTVEGPPKQ
jgi:GGDEF domain-containing protein